MHNMASLIQNDNTNSLKNPIVLKAKEYSCGQKSNCPIVEKCLSECLIYHT